MRVALLHHWLTGMRGGEKVLEAFCDLFPDADLFTLVCDREKISEKLRARRITMSFLQKMPGGPKRFRAYLPLFPRAARGFDLSGYDLVLSSDASLIKCAAVPPDAMHVCYCHSPPRYLWDQYDLYRTREASLPQRLLMPLLAGPLRKADRAAAQHVHHFIANSANVAARIRRHYGRPSTVIHPPVEADYFSALPRNPGPDYLFVGQLIAYKRADLILETASSAMDRQFTIIGDGPQRKRLQKNAPANVRFLGWICDEELRRNYSACRALIFPNDEDFGIVPLEAMAAGTPVIAFRRGGATETVVEHETGLFFDHPTPIHLSAAILQFEKQLDRFDPAACRRRAFEFSRDVFLHKMRDFLATHGVHPQADEASSANIPV